MTRRRVVAGGIEYDFAPAEPPLVAERQWAIASAQVTDEIEGRPLAVPFTVRVVLPGEPDEIAQNGARVRRLERAIAVKIGSDGTFALVAQPWLRFTPFAVPASVTVVLEADRFVPLRHTFAFAYDQRQIAAPAPAAGDRVLRLNNTNGLAAGQVLLFGPSTDSQYVRIQAVGALGQITLEAGLLNGQGLGVAVFPDVFAAPPPAALTMRRAAVQIVGRVVVRNTAANVTTAVANATVNVTDFWRTRASVIASPANGAMTDPVVALRQFCVAVTPGALGERAVGAAVGDVVQPPPLAAGDDRLLVRPAADGRQRLEVASSQNLLPPPGPLANRLLLVDSADAASAEYQTLAAIEPLGGPDEPARLTLDFALQRPHAAESRVSRIVNAPAGPIATPRALRDQTAPGNRCLFLDDLATLAPEGTLLLTGGGAADEFQRYSQFSVVSNGDGFFRLPAVQRMARLALTIDDGGGHLQTVEVEPDYGEPEQQIDVVYFV